MLILKGMRFPVDVILGCPLVRGIPAAYRHLEEVMEERGVSVVVD